MAMDKRVEEAVADALGTVTFTDWGLPGRSWKPWLTVLCRAAIEAYRKAGPAQRFEVPPVELIRDALVTSGVTLTFAARQELADAVIRDLAEWLAQRPAPEQPRAWTHDIACELWNQLPGACAEFTSLDLHEAGLRVFGKLAPVPAAESQAVRDEIMRLTHERLAHKEEAWAAGEQLKRAIQRAEKAEAEIANLRAELADVLKFCSARWEAEAEVAKLRAELEAAKRRADPPCSVCAGSRALLTGEPCLICEQTGLESFELVGLRKEIYKARCELERLRAEHARLREAARALFSACGNTAMLRDEGWRCTADAIDRMHSILEDADPNGESREHGSNRLAALGEAVDAATKRDLADAKLAADVERLKAAVVELCRQSHEFVSSIDVASQRRANALAKLDGK